MRLANGDEKAMLVNALLGVGKRWDDKRMEIIDYNPQVNNTEKKLNDFNFRAFDKVLVRDNGDDFWTADLFSYITADFSNNNKLYVCVGCSYYQCIPYEGNESLLGTTNPYKKLNGK